MIHAVGHVYDPHRDESPLLASAYHNSLRIAAAYGLASVAFPAISAGAFCFPMDRAASVALHAVVAFPRVEEHRLELVRFVLHVSENRRAFATFATALRVEIDALVASAIA
jgi:O-acetyl-ADP-ribose deacetylase (regulator of RNase III)